MTEQMNAEEQILDIILRSGYGVPSEKMKGRVRKILKAHGESERAKALREAAEIVRKGAFTEIKTGVSNSPKYLLVPQPISAEIIAKAIEALLEEAKR